MSIFGIESTTFLKFTIVLVIMALSAVLLIFSAVMTYWIGPHITTAPYAIAGIIGCVETVRLILIWTNYL